MSEIFLKRENDRLRREIQLLQNKISELEALVPKKPEQPKQSVVDKPKLDVFNPCPNDHAFNALRAQHNRRRRSWMDHT